MGGRPSTQPTKGAEATRWGEDPEGAGEDTGAKEDVMTSDQTTLPHRSYATHAANWAIWRRIAEVPEDDVEAHTEMAKTTTRHVLGTGGLQEGEPIGETLL